MTAKEKAQIGLSQLEEAIVEILYKENEPLPPHKISEHLSIPSLEQHKRRKGKKLNNYAIVHSVLLKLEIDSRVKSVPSAERSNADDWELSDRELSEQKKL